MTRSIHKLTDIKVKAAKQPGRYSDGQGLYLKVSKTGTKSWVFMWTPKGGKRKEMGLGPYPAVPLAKARLEAQRHRETVADGRDPLAERNDDEEPTFAECVESYLEKNESGWSNPKHRDQWRMTLTVYCKPIAKLRVSEVDIKAVLKVIEPIWKSKNETASRIRGRIENVLNFAKVNGWRTGENPAVWRGNLENVLPPRTKLQRGHHKAMPYAQVPEFVSLLQSKPGLSAKALELAILTGTRTSEVLKATWDEFDLENKVWTVPAPRIKARKEHRIPLSRGAMSILRPLFTKRISKFVFPGQKQGKPLSNMAMLQLLRRIGVKDATVHGFRSSFRDWVGEETDFPRELAETALAHQVGNEVERAYRRRDALEKRRTMMQQWDDFVHQQCPRSS